MQRIKNKQSKIKLELKKETRLGGEVWYCIYANGRYIRSEIKKSSAVRVFNRIVKSGLSEEKEEVIKSTIIA